MKTLSLFAAGMITVVVSTSALKAQSCNSVLECAQQAAEAAQQANDLARLLVPKGAVVAFNLENCPSGWTEFKPAFGRFVRGIDRSGGNHDPSGERSPGDLQGHAIGAHSHLHNGQRAAVPHGGGGHALGYLDRMGSRTQNNEGVETRPINVALLYCERS